MSDADRDIYTGESGARIEARYLGDLRAENGLREIDEIVTDRVRLETLDDTVAWMTIDGLRLNIAAVGDGSGARLSITAEPDGCTRQNGE